MRVLFLLLIIGALSAESGAAVPPFERFVLEDGRTLDGTYDEARHQIDVGGLGKAFVPVMPQKIAKREAIARPVPVVKAAPVTPAAQAGPTAAATTTDAVGDDPRTMMPPAMGRFMAAQAEMESLINEEGRLRERIQAARVARGKAQEAFMAECAAAIDTRPIDVPATVGTDQKSMDEIGLIVQLNAALRVMAQAKTDQERRYAAQEIVATPLLKIYATYRPSAWVRALLAQYLRTEQLRR
jgi:hypothetical protein